jgi:hypothetical protein
MIKSGLSTFKRENWPMLQCSWPILDTLQKMTNS